MSYTVQICFNYKGDLEAVKAFTEEALGIRLPNPDNIHNLHRGWLLNIQLSLGVNDFVTDGELNFSDFSYVLSLRTGFSDLFNVYVRPIQVKVAEVMGAILCYHLKADVLITIDTQQMYKRLKVSDLDL